MHIRCSAAFRRLCVETARRRHLARHRGQPPSGGCVLKQSQQQTLDARIPAAFRRLCVETVGCSQAQINALSRLQAAVC